MAVCRQVMSRRKRPKSEQARRKRRNALRIAEALALNGPVRSVIQGKARGGDAVSVQFVSSGIAMSCNVEANTAAFSLATVWLRANVTPRGEA